MGTFKHDMNDSTSQLISFREPEAIDEKSVVKEILSEMKKTRDVLEKVQENTKDSIKEMKWYSRRGDNVAVYIRMSVVSVGDIDAIKQEFQCEFYMSFRWNEPRLVGRTTDDIIDWESYWDPSIYIVDIVSYDIYEKTQKLAPSQFGIGPPDVVQYFHIKGTFKEVRFKCIFGSGKCCRAFFLGRAWGCPRDNRRGRKMRMSDYEFFC